MNVNHQRLNRHLSVIYAAPAPVDDPALQPACSYPLAAGKQRTPLGFHALFNLNSAYQRATYTLLLWCL